MILKRLSFLTLPVFLLIANGSVAEALTAPYSLTATPVSTSQIRLNWGAVNQGELSFSIERSLSSTSGFGQIGTAGRFATSYTSSGLAPGTRYYFRVRAIKNGSPSPYSNVAGATTFGVITTTTVFTTTTFTTTSTTLPALSGPVANAGADQFTQTLTMLTFNGSGSYDSGGTITSYAWTFGDGGSASGMSVAHAYSVPGSYNAVLTVTDSRGMRATDTAVVQVANRPPVANAGPDQTAAPGSSVTFNGAGSSDADGTVTAYAWNFGDGTSATGSTVTHSYAAAGTYTATLTVTDNRGAQGTDSALVTVGASAGGSLPWARRFGGAGSDIGYGVAADAAGNVVMTGTVGSATDFGGGVICPASSIFVVKYSAGGAPVWSRCLGGTSGTGTGRAVAVDGSGNVVVTGSFRGSVDFGGGPLTNVGWTDIFLAKYSATGAHLWSRRFGGLVQTFDQTGTAVAVDSGGNVIFTGLFQGTADFGGGPLVTAGDDVFVAKYSPAGQHMWSTHVQGGTGLAIHSYGKGRGVAVDAAGNVVVTGSFFGTVDFGAGAMTSPLGWSVFVTKYSAVGAVLWSKSAGGYADSGTGVAVDASGNIVVAGNFGNWLNFGTGWLQGNGGSMFVAKLAPSGTAIWVKAMMLADAADVAVDATGNIVVTGDCPSGTDLGGGPLFATAVTDIFVAKYSPAGTHLWSRAYGSSGGNLGYAVAVDGGGNVTVTGQMQGVDFGTGLLTSAGSGDIFLFKRAP